MGLLPAVTGGICGRRSEAFFTRPVVAMLLLLALLSAVADASQYCDPETQYPEVQGDQCCQKCGPGTRMAAGGDCLDPRCKPCGENEYQEAYTIKDKCDPQPYCDPNRNFDFGDPASKESRRICTCKEGFHCSSVACITCIPHTSCAPGKKVQHKGNHSHDTACVDCPSNTFSSGTSEETECTQWTACAPGFQIKMNGTATSDAVCEEKRQRLHMVTGIISIFLTLGLLVFLIFKFRGISRTAKDKGWAEICPEANDEPGAEDDGKAREAANQVSLITELHHPEDEESWKTPEENEDQDELSEPPSRPAALGGANLTDNGNVYAQEDGEKTAVPRQESQPSTLVSL